MSRLSGNKLIDGWLSDRSMAGGGGATVRRGRRRRGVRRRNDGGPPQATHCLTCNNRVGLANPESGVLVATVNCGDLLRRRFPLCYAIDDEYWPKQLHFVRWTNLVFDTLRSVNNLNLIFINWHKQPCSISYLIANNRIDHKRLLHIDNLTFLLSNS